jgi:hypothetical protein
VEFGGIWNCSAEFGPLTLMIPFEPDCNGIWCGIAMSDPPVAMVCDWSGFAMNGLFQVLW